MTNSDEGRSPTSAGAAGASSTYVVDAARSRVRVQTFAEGLLARLAHDLELACTLTGTASGAGEAGAGAASGKASLEAPLRGIEVVGVLGKDGTVDERALSASERRDILAKMQSEVFHAGAGDVVRVEVQLDEGNAKVRIVTPSGKAVEVALRPELRAEGNSLRAKGTFAISLSTIGSDVVKGPMGAFRVKDRVAIVFDVAFTPSA